MYLQSEEIWTFNYVAIIRCDGIFFNKIVAVEERWYNIIF